MGKKVIKLTEIDIENIVKKVISEQSESDNCTGSNEVNPPFIKILEIRYKDENGKFGTGGDIPAVVKFHLRAFFPTAGSSDEVYQDALSQLKKLVEDELSSKQLIAEYDLELVRVTNVIGSASNYFNGPLQPTHRGGKPIESSKLSSEPYVNLPKEGDSDWNKNKGYADSRWENMVSYINKNGKSLGFGIGKDLKAPEQTEFRISDTGGCTDEKRDVNKYKGPGQYVIVNGLIKLKPKPLDPDKIEEFAECATGLKIIVGYFKESTTAMDTGIKMPKNSVTHSCDYATFTISCNGTVVGIANMNNGEGRLKYKSPKTMIGLDQPNVIYRPPSKGNTSKGRNNIEGFGDTVYSIIDVDDDKLQEIIKNSTDGKIKMTIQGTQGSLVRPESKGFHADAPMVCAYIEETKGGNEVERKIVYGPKEPFNRKGSRDVGPGVSQGMGSFNPCKIIKKI
jgi:hypothetical protein